MLKNAVVALAFVVIVIIGFALMALYVWPLSPFQLLCNAEQAQNPYFSCLFTTL